MHLRPPKLEEVLKRNLSSDSVRELSINPEGKMFNNRNLAAAIRRAKVGDVIVVPPGEYPAFEIKKDLRLRSQLPGTVVFRGTMVIRSEFASFSGLEFRGGAGKSAFQVEKGTLVLKDCIIRGEITAGAPDANIELYLKGCLAGQTDEGIVLSHQTLLELSDCRISDCRIGLVLRSGATAALYHSRIESCLSSDESDPGVGIYSEKATLYCEGVALRNNGIGVYLKDNPETHLLYTLIQDSQTSALIAANGTSSSTVQLHSCVTSQQLSSQCPQFSLSGGVVRLAHCRLQTSPASALSCELSRLEMKNCSFVAEGISALDLHSCHVTAESLFVEATGAPALTASGCHGEFRDCRFLGQPSTAVTLSPQLQLASNILLEVPLEVASDDSRNPGPTIATATKFLKESVVQESVRKGLERILRLAHAGQERKLQGLPVTDRHFHCVFMGPAGTGKRAAAGVLAKALFAFEAISNPRVAELHLEDLEPSPSGESLAKPREEGAIFLRVRDAVPISAGIRQALTQLFDQADKADKVVILGGERDPLRRAQRAVHGLERMFRKTLFFTRYGPIELATHFAKLCAADQIMMSSNAIQTLLATLHYYCERKDKRFSNTTGVEVLYESSRHCFLERCSLANRMDLELEARDLEIPPDSSLQTVLDRSPAFVTWCPNCHKENPWLPELAPSFVCLHCETPYSAPWGTWKEAATYRETRSASGPSGSVSRPLPRVPLPSRLS